MILGVCGSSSTGKTTLLDALRREVAFTQKLPNRTCVDARAILRSMGHHSMDRMTKQELQIFQRTYIQEKLRVEEAMTNFCVDRTFVDIAAFWICRDAPRGGALFEDEVVALCRSKAANYTLHVFLPFGVIPFQSDGYRSEDMQGHQAVSDCMRVLLEEWKLNWIELDNYDLNWRVNRVLTAIQ